jgi:hypothetical protein
MSSYLKYSKSSRATFNEFVEGRTFKNPETENCVQFTSLPSDEQKRIRQEFRENDDSEKGRAIRDTKKYYGTEEGRKSRQNVLESYVNAVKYLGKEHKTKMLEAPSSELKKMMEAIEKAGGEKALKEMENGSLNKWIQEDKKEKKVKKMRMWDDGPDPKVARIGREHKIIKNLRENYDNIKKEIEKRNEEGAKYKDIKTRLENASSDKDVSKIKEEFESFYKEIPYSRQGEYPAEDIRDKKLSLIDKGVNKVKSLFKSKSASSRVASRYLMKKQREWNSY